MAGTLELVVHHLSQIGGFLPMEEMVKIETEIREGDTKKEKIKEAVLVDREHMEVATKEVEDIPQAHPLTRTIQRIEDSTTTATHPSIEVGTKEADTKLVGSGAAEIRTMAIGVEETQEVQIAEVGKGTTAVVTPQSSMVKAISAWTRQHV